MLLRSLGYFLFAFVLPASLSRHAVAAEKSALEIFDSAVATFESQRVALREWQYHQTLITHQLDAQDKVIARGMWRSIVRPGDPGPLEYTAEKMEGKLSFFKAGSEEETKAAPKKTKAELEEKNQAESALEAVQKYNLRNRYNWKLMADENVAGESAYVLAFQPKAGQSAKSREERFFGLLAGRVWISRSDSTILKAEASLQTPCNLFWVIARVTTFQFTYQLEPVRGGERLLRPSKATAKTVVAFPFYSVRQRHWLSVDKFEPRTARAAKAQP